MLYATSVSAGRGCRFPIARYLKPALNPVNQMGALFEVLQGTAQHGFTAVAIACDGAGENRGMQSDLLALTPITAQGLLTPVVRRKFDVAGQNCPPLLELLAMAVAFEHPVTGAPVFLVPDLMHVIKRWRNAMSSRNIEQHKDGVVLRAGLKMLQSVYEEVEALGAAGAMRGAAHMTTSKFSQGHFILDNWLKMRCKHAVQIFSESMRGLVLQHLKVPKFQAHAPMFSAILEVIEKFDRFIGIFNTRPESQHKPGKKTSAPIRCSGTGTQIDEMIDILAFVVEWKAGMPGDCTGPRGNFAPGATCDDFVRLALVGVAMPCSFVGPRGGMPGGSGRFLRLADLQQDFLEHHFGHLRNAAGSTQALNAGVALRANGASVVVHAPAIRRGNCSRGVRSGHGCKTELWARQLLKKKRKEHAARVLRPLAQG